MKYLKMLGLAAVAAMALMAFLGAGNASATVLCKTTPVTDAEGAEACAEKEFDVNSGSTIEATLTSGQTAELNGLWTNVTCKKSTLSGTTSNTGGATETVTVSLSGVTFEECGCAEGSNNAHVTILEKGSLEVHHVASTHNATLTTKGQKVTINCTSLGVQCIFGISESTHLGTVTGGEPATVSAEATVNWISGDSSSFICGSTAGWEANYSITKPSPVYSAELAYSMATMSKSIKQKGVDVKLCEFDTANDKKQNCTMTLKVTGDAPNWKIEKTGFVGDKASDRYKVISAGCTVNKTMKDGESCSDEIEMVKKEAPSSNEWCVYASSDGSSLKMIPFCVLLKTVM